MALQSNQWIVKAARGICHPMFYKRFHQSVWARFSQFALVSGTVFSLGITPSVAQSIAQASPFSQESAQENSTQRLLEPVEVSGWLDLFRPPNTGRPKDTTNGSSRDGIRCLVEEPLMQPLLPEGRYGLTTKARPGIVVDIPETSAQQVLLSIRNESDNSVYQAMLAIPETSGPVSFRLPEDAPPLAIDQTYRWSLTFICGDYYTPGDPAVVGWVRRVEPSAEMTESMAARSPDEQAQWLSENGYWYDLSDYILTSSAFLL